eukprot:TRINITY_DN232_c0_g2_i1.p1 TRINITY_DN232_c0_g2~~TRINITY_DN232_c0_g2_i1.p1  ORF type:complete len:201 (+),score=40.35 TRINITY_DN232_c0_g2_i1:93-695(+)
MQYLLLCVLFCVALVNGQRQEVATCDGRSPSDDHAFHSSWGNVDYDESKLEITAPQAISRDEIMACANEWVSKKIPYCQCNGAAECCGSCPYCHTTRCDCSGYVSHCWGLTRGYTTRSLPEVAHKITKEELKPGDIMLNTSEHVIIFGGWENNKTKTHYHAFQEPGCHTNGPHHAFSEVTVYPNSWDPEKFIPYRFNHVL